MSASLAEVNERLLAVKAKMAERSRLQSRLEALRRDEPELEARVKALRRQMERDGRDVRRLEGMSLTALFHELLGSREERLVKERREFLAAKLKHDEAAARLATVRSDRAAAEQTLAGFGALDEEYTRVVASKEELLKSEETARAREFFALGEQEAEARRRAKELEEAVDAGRAAEVELRRLVGSLDSAEGFGTWDLLGGGMIATAMKHSHLDDARDRAHQAQQALSLVPRRPSRDRVAL